MILLNFKSTLNPTSTNKKNRNVRLFKGKNCSLNIPTFIFNVEKNILYRLTLSTEFNGEVREDLLTMKGRTISLNKNCIILSFGGIISKFIISNSTHRLFEELINTNIDTSFFFSICPVR